VRCRGSILLSALLFAACATAPTRRDGRAPTPAPARAGECLPLSRILVPATRTASEAALAYDGSGLAVVWAERGPRTAIHFHPVDLDGAPRGPISEVVDRDAAVSELGVSLEPPGYRVSWSEPGGRFQRLLDGRGRPRSDVGPTRVAAVPSPHRCQPGANQRLVCAGQGHDVEIPASGRVLAEVIGSERPAVIVAGEDGLRLWTVSCAVE